MKSNYKRLGDYIQLVDTRNKDGAITNLLGINITKNFMPSVANVSKTDLSKYKVIKKGQFACNLMHVGRDERLPISLFKADKKTIISPAYKIFEIINRNKIIPEYLMIEFHRLEFDRYMGYICDSSIRGGLEWERFCDIKIPIPSIDIQKKYVAVYNNLLNNQKTYENSLEDLQLICDSYIENLIKIEEPKVLGDYIQQSEERNKELTTLILRGVSTNKKLIKSKANLTGVNFSTYKILKKGQFVYVSDTSRRGDKIALAMNDNITCIVSAIYTVFEINNKSELLSEYLFLWFRRKEFDRYARFNSWGSARETFDWDEMCRVELPIPDIKIQEAIITIYHTLETRKRINEELKESLKPLCPILMRGVVEELNRKDKA